MPYLHEYDWIFAIGVLFAGLEYVHAVGLSRVSTEFCFFTSLPTVHSTLVGHFS